MRLVVVAVVTLVLLAGCSGYSSTDPATQAGTSTDTEVTVTHNETTTPVENDSSPEQFTIQVGEFGFEYSQTASRVERLLVTDIPPTKISIVDLPTDSTPRCSRSTLYERLNVPCEATEYSAPVFGSVDPDTHSITVRRGDDASSERVEALFVHELVHVLQYERGVTYTQFLSGSATTVDERNTARALIEGHAEYAEREYESEYFSRVTPDARWQYENRSGSQSAGVYYFGARYFESTASAVSDSWETFESPPETTEAILHPSGTNLTSKPITVKVGESIEVVDRNTMGELATRNILRSRLSGETAETAAAGWGNDSVYHVRTGSGGEGSVWVTRWDTKADAREFARALSDYRSSLTEARRQGIHLTRRDGVVVVEIDLPDSVVVETRTSGTVSIGSG